jgi:hypothetical protein
MIAKSPSVVFSALLVVSFAGAGPAASKTKPRVQGAQLASAQVGGGAQRDAMAQCESYYGGQRFFLGRERYAYIEQCYHSATGKYPHQTQTNCKVDRC